MSGVDVMLFLIGLMIGISIGRVVFRRPTVKESIKEYEENPW